jgi:hypothetical protein
MMQDATKAQIAALNISVNKPLLIVDADEVLVQFLQPFTRYLQALDWQIHLTEYRLEYAIRRADGLVADEGETFALVQGFIDAETHRQPTINGAATALSSLAKQAQIVVLSNVPQRRYLDRLANLRGHAMDYALVANAGPKGPALAALSAGMNAPIAFIDDSPAQIESAAEHAAHIHRIHFAGCPVIKKVLPDVKCANATPDDWSGVASHVDRLFGTI